MAGSWSMIVIMYQHKDNLIMTFKSFPHESENIALPRHYSFLLGKVITLSKDNNGSTNTISVTSIRYYIERGVSDNTEHVRKALLNFPQYYHFLAYF